jgi:hypothetical protein
MLFAIPARYRDVKYQESGAHQPFFEHLSIAQAPAVPSLLIPMVDSMNEARSEEVVLLEESHSQ